MRVEGVIKKTGIKPGKTLAIFVGVHGNEKAGVLALEELMVDIEISRGEVYFVYANPRAIERNIRYIDKNLNRCFLKEKSGQSYEENRAQELLPILNECDALLDLHASNNKKATPFIICEENYYALAEIFDFNIVSFGWNDIEPGAADGYMHLQGKPGVCLECGSVYQAKENIDLARHSILQFLSYYKAIDRETNYYNKPGKIIKVFRAIKKKTADLEFIKQFADFEELPAGEVFARDGEEEYVAGKGEYIIFPDSKKGVGEEAFILGREYLLGE
jgi:succinylglutamate desuccinylase